MRHTVAHIASRRWGSLSGEKMRTFLALPAPSPPSMPIVNECVEKSSARGKRITVRSTFINQAPRRATTYDVFLIPDCLYCHPCVVFILLILLILLGLQRRKLTLSIVKITAATPTASLAIAWLGGDTNRCPGYNAGCSSSTLESYGNGRSNITLCTSWLSWLDIRGQVTSVGTSYWCYFVCAPSPNRVFLYCRWEASFSPRPISIFLWFFGYSLGSSTFFVCVTTDPLVLIINHVMWK